MTRPGTRPFVFLDRDGTLLEEREYAFRLEDYAVLPGAHAAVARLRASGFGVVVLSNQSGIARGIFGEADHSRFAARLREDFASRGAALDGYYHCPHAPDAGCDCRKPRTGLALRVMREHGVDLARSFVIGDKDVDVELARNLGCRGILVRTGHGAAHVGRVPPGTPIAGDLADAVERFVLADAAAQRVT